MAGPGVRVVSRHRRRGHGERGAVLIFTALILAALVAAVSVSVDVGVLSFTKRSLQSIADAAAMDARFALGNGSSTCAQAISLADGSAQKNGLANPATNLAVTLGTVKVVNNTETFVPDQTGATTCTGDPDQAAATTVHVVTQSTQAKGGSLLEPTATRTATANWAQSSAIPETGVIIGTNLAALNSQNSPVLNSLFGSLLGGTVDLTAVGYQGLANSNVTLGNLAVALKAGSVSELLNTTITYPQLLNAEAQALGAGPQGASVLAALSVLNGLIAIPPVGGAFPIAFNLGQLLSIKDPGQSSAADIGVNALGLLTSAVEIAHGSSGINIPSIDLNVPGISNVSANVSIVQPPQMAYGPVGTSATTAQVNLTLTISTSLLGLANVDVPLTVMLAKGTAKITKIACGANYPPPTTFTVQTSAASVQFGSQANQVSVSLLGIGLVQVYGPISVGNASDTGPLPLTAPFPKPIPGETLTLQGTNLNGLQTFLLGIPLGSLLSPVENLLLPVLNPVISGVLDPLIEQLGVAVDGGFVNQFDPPTAASCGTSGGFLF